MSVLVDTSVWSLAFRRGGAPTSDAVAVLKALISEGRACMIGAIRQELLSGIREAAQFEKLRDRLRAFPDLDLDASDYERAAELCNACRTRGVEGSPTDFLVCAAAVRHDVAILTSDQDFARFASHLSIVLHAGAAGAV